ncbi:single-stranded-DNA-specific exonuclease RecJ [Granulicella sp. WH15]|uniref:single-stranded-DNA-specific exonuclease RecJ n=1 Tax=Granulicella sp. WH15 TaxID=2602070 RepID=UPI001367091B|nr:single-stranded-DNA-specific exonuclease RecJ [Granulicella sp. WH15]QHN04028.1 single-stranded-DNA-specific exonuclease RecJ [Granulicella sp. WH15]
MEARQRWVVCEPDEALAARLRQALECPAPIARLLVSRGIADAAAAQTFFTPTLADLHDPLTMLGMATAVARIQAAVHAGEPILIYGDYDVDGTTATVLLKTAIERLATPAQPARVSYHVPHRLREGYGIQNSRLAEAATDGVRLVISVDTGIRAFAAAEEARALGLDLIVTDHHLPDGVTGVPDAIAVVNPAQAGCGYANKSLCGAGVAFKLAHALLASAATTEAQRTFLNDRLLPSFLKLVAIATVADSVPLTGENRAIVWLGLRELRNPVQPGLRALMEVAKLPLDRSPTATEVGFRIAPRINAAGRMDVASDVVELFLTRDEAQARQLATRLDTLNQDRRASEAAALEAIEMQLLTLRDATGQYPPECIVLGHPEWHRGVLGILASRVVDRTGRPALVMTDEDGQAHGSGRSIEGFHLLDALTAVHGPDPEDGVFTRFGGHAHAVGFSLPTAELTRLRERMKNHTAGVLTGEMLAPQVNCDLEVSFSELTPDLYAWLERLEPFGMDHPEPVFLSRGLVLTGFPRIIKEVHVCLPLAAAPGERPLNAMGWSRSGAQSWAERISELGITAGSKIDVVYKLKENTHPQYGGLELHLVDFAPGQ